MRCFESIEKVKWQYTMASNTMCRFQIKMQRSVFFRDIYLNFLSFGIGTAIGCHYQIRQYHFAAISNRVNFHCSCTFIAITLIAFFHLSIQFIFYMCARITIRSFQLMMCLWQTFFLDILKCTFVLGIQHWLFDCIWKDFFFYIVSVFFRSLEMCRFHTQFKLERKNERKTVHRHRHTRNTMPRINEQTTHKKQTHRTNEEKKSME